MHLLFGIFERSARIMASSKKTAAGCGNIRKKIIRRGGKEYEYWEARYTVGFDPGTGKQVQKSAQVRHRKKWHRS